MKPLEASAFFFHHFDSAADLVKTTRVGKNQCPADEPVR